jgi:hypothetical protein
VCISAYIASFFAPPVDKFLPWGVLLFAGVFINILVIYFIEAPHTKWGPLTWKQFHRDMPGWVSQCEIVFWVLAVAQFLWMFKRFGAGVPTDIEGEYVLDSHGHILRELTEAEYLDLRCLMLRCFAFMYTTMYFEIAMYWWFRRAATKKLSRNG